MGPPPREEDASDAISIWRTIAIQGAAIEHIKGTQSEIREELREHQRGEDSYKQAMREAMEQMSGKIATLTGTMEARLTSMNDSVTSKFDSLSGQLSTEIETRRDNSSQVKGGWKVITYVATAIGGFFIFLGWVVTQILSFFSQHPPK